MERRNFLKKGTLLASGLLLHHQMLEAFSLSESADIINIAVIGCGDRGNGLISVMKTLPDKFRIVAICDVLDFRIKDCLQNLKNPQVKVYKDYRELLEDNEVQAVIISAPLYLHQPMAMDVLDAGKHLYLEKTMTHTTEQALKLVEKAKTKPKQILQVGHQYRYTPLYFKVKDMIKKGYLGKVTQVDCRWDRNGSWRRPVPSPELERAINWRMYKEYSGGLTAEILSHQIDFINWAFDTHPDVIQGIGGIDFYKDGREVNDNTQLMLRYDNDGMVGNFGATCANSHDGYLFKIKGSKGMVSLLIDEGIYYPEPKTKKELDTVDGVTGATKISWNKDGGFPILEEPTKDGTWYSLTDFHKCINTGQMPTSNVVTGATTAFTVHAANKAMYNRSIEYWKPIYNI